MSNTIDTNVVQLKFDNKQFEENCKQSMNTLEKLKQKINSSNSGSALNGLEKAMDTSKIEASLNSLSKRFSTLGVVGMTVVSNITTAAMRGIGNIASSIKSMIYGGGLSRALNIEQARFQIQGLEKDWNALSEDIDYAVSGTAYGFDAAAKAAAQLSASGVEAGDAMKTALRGISGVAAMANVSYEEISPIFTTVAGQSKVMTMQLRQLESRGLNAAATMADYFKGVMNGSIEASDSIKAHVAEITAQFGYGEAAVRDMVSKGVIDFNTFSNAMDNAFGEHAKDANKTFTGVMANIRAAFARIGADFITPIVTQESPIVLMLQRVREQVVDLKNRLQPLVKVWVELVRVVGETGQKIVSSFSLAPSMRVFYDSLHVIFNVLEATYRILKPLGEAFKEVFPKKSERDVLGFTNALIEFSEKLKMSDEHMGQLKIAFKGVFDVIKLLVDGITGAIKIIFGLSDEVDGLSDSFFNAAEAIGVFLSGLADTIRNSKILQDISGGLKNILSGIADTINSAFESIGLGNSDGLTKFSDGIKKATSPIEIFATIFKGAFGVVAGVISSVVPRVIAVMGKLGTVIKDTFDAMIESFGGGSGSEAMTVLNGGLLAYLLTKMKSLVGNLTNLVTGLKNGAVANVLNQLKSSLFAWQKDLEADALLKLAGAVAILVTSLVMLTGIDDAALARATVAIGGLMAMLALVAGQFDGAITKITKSDKIGGAIRGIFDSFQGMLNNIKMQQMADALLTFAGAVVVLAVAVKMLADLDTASLAKGMTAVTVLLGELVLVTKVLSSEDAALMKGIGKLILLAGAVDLLTIAVKVLGGMDLAGLAKGLVSVGVLLLEIVGFSKLVGQANLLGVGLAMIPLAAGLDLLTIAIKVLGDMDLIGLAKGLSSIAIIFLELAGFSKLVNPVSLLAIGAAMLPIAAALDILSISIAALGTMSLENLAKGLGSVAVVLAELGVFSKLVNPAKLLGISAALLVFSAAMVPFSASMGALSLLSWEGIVKGFIAIAGALTILGVASAVLTPIIPAMLGVGAALLLLGTAAMAAGAGVALISTALVTLAGFGVAGVAALAGTLTALAGLIPTMVHMLAQLVSELLTAAVTLIPQFSETVVLIISAILATLAEHIPDIVESGVKLIVGLVEGLAQGVPKIAKAVVDLINAFILALGVEIPRIVDAGFKMIIEFLNGMADSIRANTPLLIDAVNNMMEAIIFAIGAWIGNFINGGADITGALIDGIKSVDGPAAEFASMLEDVIDTIEHKIEDVWNAGKDFVNGFISGITGGKRDAKTAAAEVGAAAEDGLRSKDGIDAHSDSKKSVAAGKDFGHGTVTGITQYTDSAYGAGAALGDSAAFGLSDHSAFLGDFFNKLTGGQDKVVKSGQYMTEEKKKQVDAWIKEKKAAEEATTANNEYSESAEKSGKSSSKASEKVKELSVSFQAVERGAKVSLSSLVNSMADNYRETVLWAKDMKDLMGKGFDKSITDAIQKMGVGGRETVKAYLSASEEQIPAINALYKRALTLEEDAKKYIEGDYEAFTADIGAVISEGITAWNTQLEESVNKALDPFGEFDAKTELTSNKLLANMNSQLTGIRAWGDNLSTLVERGVNDGIIQHLIELGPKSYEQVNAMVNMTSEQLAEMNNIWDQQTHLGEEIALKFAEKMREIGGGVSEGFVAGIDFNAVSQSGTDIGTKVTEAAKTKLEINSPSHVFQRIGAGLPEGLGLGVRRNGHLAYTALIEMAQHCKDVTYQILNEEAGEEIGMFFMRGLARGIGSGKSDVINELESMANSVIEKAKQLFKINSPSKVFREIGLGLDEGLAQGIDRGTDMATSATSRLGNNTIQMMNDIIKNISADVNDSPELQPVIRPRLDLTALQNGKSRIGSMLDNPAYEMATSVAANMVSSTVNAQTTPSQIGNTQNIIINQTNNSPKALDAYDIYRNTRNLVPQLQGALS